MNCFRFLVFRVQCTGSNTLFVLTPKTGRNVIFTGTLILFQERTVLLYYISPSVKVKGCCLLPPPSLAAAKAGGISPWESKRSPSLPTAIGEQ
jgi:hypothetical protein